MGFVVYGEFLRALRGNEEQWGLLADQTVWIANNLGADDADVMLRVEATQPTTEIDWRTVCPGVELAVQLSRHCWLYVGDHMPFDAAQIGLETRLLRLHMGDRHLIRPSYRGLPMQLIYPRPSDYALEQSAQPVRTPAEAIDFLNYHPCGPVERFTVKNGKWVQSEVPSPNALEPTEQPATIKLRHRLMEMNETLLANGIFAGEVHGDPASESWYEIVDHIDPVQLTKLGKQEAHDVPIAWYPLSRFGEDAVEDMLREVTDPEGLVEEWWDRLNLTYIDEPVPGISSTTIYFMGGGNMTSADVGGAVVDAATAIGLHPNWNGDPKRSIDVKLDAVVT